MSASSVSDPVAERTVADAPVTPGRRVSDADLLGSPPPWLYLVTASALVLGLWARFKGLGAWPLNADEYYIARSVEDILRTGLPEYDCGGYYTRGLLFQYFVALLQWTGVSPEVSARLLAATSSAVALPAIYLLGRRLGGQTVGLLAVAATALSAWEVDIARFGRMYAPFQAVFAWYLLCFLRVTVDRDSGALRLMLLLSMVGLFTWEGGVLLLATNLLLPFLRAPDGRLTRRDLAYLGGSTLLLAIGFYVTQMIDFRRIGTQAFPAGVDPDEFYVGEPEPSLFDLLQPTAPMIIVGLALGILALFSLRWIFGFRRRWPTALGLLVATGAALAHQFSLAGTVVVLMMLAGMLDWRELCARGAFPFLALLATSAAAWAALGLLNPDFLSLPDVPWHGNHRLLALAHMLLGLPDYGIVIALPWSREAPILGLMLLLAILVAVVQVLRSGDHALTNFRVTMVLVCCLLALAATSQPPRLEIRYVYFLHATTIAILVTVAARFLSEPPLRNSLRAGAAAAFTAAVLYAGGDLALHHLINIDTTRVDQVARVDRHVVTVMKRTDVRSVAKWLEANATFPSTLVVNAYPSVDFYFSGFDLAYIDRSHQRYWAYACNRGRTERWGNLPLVATIDDLAASLVQHPRSILVVDTRSLDRVLLQLARYGPKVAWVSADKRITILEILPAATTHVGSRDGSDAS